MDWLSVLLGGFVGAVFGVLATILLEVRRERVGMEGAARAVHLELAQNATALGVSAKTGLYVPLDQTTWRDARLNLSGAVSPGNFAIVGSAYSKIAAIIAASFPTTGGSSPRLMAAAALALPSVQEAADLLEMVGWPKTGDRSAWRRGWKEIARKP